MEGKEVRGRGACECELMCLPDVNTPPCLLCAATHRIATSPQPPAQRSQLAATRRIND
jgi:hypothetical protein